MLKIYKNKSFLFVSALVMLKMVPSAFAISCGAGNIGNYTSESGGSQSAANTTNNYQNTNGYGACYPGFSCVATGQVGALIWKCVKDLDIVNNTQNSAPVAVSTATPVPIVAPIALSCNSDVYSKYKSMSATDVYKELVNGGVGGCFVYESNNPSNECGNYFLTKKRTGSNYGAPVYNTDNSNASYYAGDGNSSRMTSKNNSQASTGCFGPKGGQSWGGNNRDEANLSKEDYAKKILLEIITDQTDPCALGCKSGTQNAQNNNTNSGTSAAVSTGIMGVSIEDSAKLGEKIWFSLDRNGKPDPTICKSKGKVYTINGKKMTDYTQFPAPFCNRIFKAISANKNASINTKTPNGLPELPLSIHSDQAGIRKAIGVARSKIVSDSMSKGFGQCDQSKNTNYNLLVTKQQELETIKNNLNVAQVTISTDKNNISDLKTAADQGNQDAKSKFDAYQIKLGDDQKAFDVILIKLNEKLSEINKTSDAIKIKCNNDKQFVIPEDEDLNLIF